ncbi:hypothetical protein KHC28_24120 [Ancylobacter sonchi]|uniref:hypothetical protein n=1 Tax=Ancylobacter sonchi TaxID=1937790 RepID=UPI001BD654A9|nr:hypothetical protein [Ancylobacter sonchi]MBS7536741.1 hypothetical protein [Ancylobacter sonchi]
MKPSYMSRHDARNHDELFAFLMRSDERSDNFARNFFDIFNNIAINSSFSPLLTNRLLTPILPKDINPEEDLRRRVRNRIDTIFGSIGNYIEGELNCLIIIPDPVELSFSIQLSLMLEDGYTEERAKAVSVKLLEVMEFSEYKIRSSGIFSRVEKRRLPSGASFVSLYATLLSIGIDLPKIPPAKFLLPTQVMDFYLIESLIPLEVRKLLLHSRPTNRSQITRSFYQLLEALLYTYPANKYLKYHQIAEDAGDELNFARVKLADAFEIDEAARFSFLYKNAELSQ